MSDGQDNDKPQTEAEKKAGAVADAEGAIHRYMQPVLDTVIRGMVNVMAAVPIKVTLLSVCRVTGFLMANLYAGDEIAVLQFRKEARDAFREGIKSVPPAPLAKTQ